MAVERPQWNRRNLLRGVAGASAATAAGALAIGEKAQAYTPPGDETRQRYRETDHVKAFYRTNGYETKNRK